MNPEKTLKISNRYFLIEPVHDFFKTTMFVLYVLSNWVELLTQFFLRILQKTLNPNFKQKNDSLNIFSLSFFSPCLIFKNFVLY
jgi:hypothetical protein